MAQDKAFRTLNAKLDALLEKAGIKPEDVTPTSEPARAPRELTAAEQQAIDNAPKAEATIPPQEKGPRVTEQNAPSTAASVPKDESKGDAKKSKK